MKAILIGSRAYKEHDFNDTDIVCDAEWKAAWDETYGALAADDVSYETSAGVYETCEGIYEVIVPPAESAHAALLDMGSGLWPEFEGDWLPPGLKINVTPLSFLAALKKAHLILPSSSPEKWRRQMEEYVELKERCASAPTEKALFGGSPPSYSHVIYDMHRVECLAKVKKHPKLAQDKQGFFGTEAYEIFDHDSIHEALAWPKKPAYLGMKDGEVWCSRRLWFKMPEEERLRCVVEEASILALERSVLPALFLDKGYRGARWAYEHALMKICTTITSGFFRDYCIEAWAEAKDSMPDIAKLFFDGVKRGTVKCRRPEILGAAP